MKTTLLHTLRSLILFALPLAVRAQGTFQNLDFESANLPVLQPGQSLNVAVADALPGWTAYLGAEPQTTVLYNAQTLSDASISILGPNYELPPVIEGNFTAVLKAGNYGIGKAAASLAQVGQVPVFAESLHVKVLTSTESFIFSLGGVPIQMVLLASEPSFSLYAGDVSGFAGQVTELRLTAPTTGAQPYYGFRVDSIVFSPQAIPEPNAVALFLLGSACWFAWMRRRRWT
jgi:hypothetical protein